jgi:transmembrane sensor
MTEEPTWRVLDAYLSGSATPAELEIVRQWLAAAPGRREAIEALRTTPANEARDWDVDAAWSRVAASVQQQPVPSLRTRTLARAPRYAGAWRIAAILLVTAGVGVAGREWMRSRDGSTTAARTTADVATGVGQRLSVHLPDGSTVRLNAGSRLQYATGDDGARTVTLDGEGYFDVRHDARHPFRVRAHGSVAEDVGTRFVVRAYPEQRDVRVAVEEGAVRVNRVDGTTEPGLVTAGMLGTIPASGAPTVTPLSKQDRYFAWTDGELSLDGQPFRDVIPMLGRWYGVSIRTPDSALGERRVFGTFRHESVADAMATLALALDATYSQAGSTITFAARTK